MLRLPKHQRRFWFHCRSILPRAILDIAADRECPLSVRLKYDHLNVWIFLGLAAIADDRLHHVPVHRVQRLRTVERDPGNLIFDFVQNFLFASGSPTFIFDSEF